MGVGRAPWAPGRETRKGHGSKGHGGKGHGSKGHPRSCRARRVFAPDTMSRLTPCRA